MQAPELTTMGSWRPGHFWHFHSTLDPGGQSSLRYLSSRSSRILFSRKCPRGQFYSGSRASLYEC